MLEDLIRGPLYISLEKYRNNICTKKECALAQQWYANWNEGADRIYSKFKSTIKTS